MTLTKFLHKYGTRGASFQIREVARCLQNQNLTEPMRELADDLEAALTDFMRGKDHV